MDQNETLTNHSYSFLEEKWNKFLDNTSNNNRTWVIMIDTNKFISILSADDPFIMWIFGLNGSMFVIYWIVGAIYMLMDTYNIPALRKYKTQPGKNEPVDWIKLRKVVI